MKIPYSFIVILSLSIALFSCKNKEAALNSTEPDTSIVKKTRPERSDELLIQIETTPCFGKCPVYSMTIQKNGKVQYTGRKFVTHEGSYNGRINGHVIDSISSMLADIEYLKLENEYDQNVTDLPTTTTTAIIDGTTKSVKARIGFPDKLRDFHKYLYQLSERIEWNELDQEDDDE